MYRDPDIGRRIRNVGEPLPVTPDMSTPKFANDSEHILSIANSNRGRGFPVLPINYGRAA